MVNVKTELERLGIPADSIESMLEYKKTEETWQRLLDDLQNLDKGDRIEVIEKIIAKTPERKKKTGEEVSKMFIKSARFPEIQGLAIRLMEREREIICLDREPKLKITSDEFDQRKECKGDATYVCHHCGRNLCSQHSYWIPDIEFPYFVKKEIEEEEYKDPGKMSRAKAIGILGFFAFMIGVLISGIVNVAYGVGGIVLGILLFIAAAYIFSKAKIGVFFPTYFKLVSTKWDRQIQIIYEHQGYYLAVHCWQCLKTKHEKFYYAASEILNRIYNESKGWKKLKGKKSIKLPEHTRLVCATFAANRFLNEFKFTEECHMPLEFEKFDLRLMSRPIFSSQYNSVAISKSNHYNPTPVWIFWPATKLKFKKAPKISINDWVDENRPQIKGWGGVTPGKSDIVKVKKIKIKKRKMRLVRWADISLAKIRDRAKKYTSRVSASRGGEGTKARSSENAAGTYKTISGRVKTVKPLSASQQRKYPIKAEKWKKIPRERLERLSDLLKVVGGFFAFIGFLMFFGVLMSFTIFLDILLSSIIILLFGLIFLAAGLAAYKSGTFRRKFLVLTEEETKKTPETEIEAIIERFLKSP